jgi:hypothetical protein
MARHTASTVRDEVESLTSPFEHHPSVVSALADLLHDHLGLSKLKRVRISTGRSR